jgi:hypothetical protein
MFILGFGPKTNGTLRDRARFYDQAKLSHYRIECIGGVTTFLNIKWKFCCPSDLVGRPFIPGDTFVEE